MREQKRLPKENYKLKFKLNIEFVYTKYYVQ